MKASIEMRLQGLEPAALASQIGGLFTQWDNGRAVWKQTVREVQEYVYATSTKQTTNASNPWSHTTHIPKLTQIRDNLGANYHASLFQRKDFFDFDAADQDSATLAKRSAIKAYLMTKHNYSDFFQTMKECSQDYVDYGNCFAVLNYVREIGPEDKKTGKPGRVVYEGPKLKRILPWDIVFDYTAMSFEDAPKIVRSVIGMGELMRRVEETPDMYGPDEIAKAKLFYQKLSGFAEGEINQAVNFCVEGWTSPSAFYRAGYVEVLDFYGDIYDPATGELHKQCMISVLDRRFVLRNRPLADLQGFGKIYHAGWRKRPGNLWAQGPLDNLVGMQYSIDHLENSKADAFDKILSPDLVIVGRVQVKDEAGRRVYIIDDANGRVSNLGPDTSVLSADNQIALKEAQMEAFAGAPREALGIRSPGEKTAYEVSQLQSAAGRFFQTKLFDLDIDFVEKILNGELELAVTNLTTTDLVNILDPDLGVLTFVNITAEDLQVSGRLRAQGATHYAQRAQLVQELQGFQQTLGQDPKMAQHFPAQKRAELWDRVLNLQNFALLVPFGQIDEDIETAKRQQAAQSVVDSHAAGTGAIP